MTSRASQNKRKLPPARVVVLPVGTGLILAFLFGVLMGSWIAGGVVGLLFAAGFTAVLVLTARGAGKKKKKTRLR